MITTPVILAAHLTIASWYHSPFAGDTCASWDYPLGTRLRVTEVHNGLSVVVTVRERGPARWVVRKGVTIDLSAPAFEKLDGLAMGHAEVKVQPR